LGRINWTRLIICGLVAGIVWTVTSALSTWFVGADFNAAVPGNKIFAPSAGLAAFLLAVNLAGGIWAIWLYASIRPCYGAGAKTAAIAGMSWWIVSTLADATWGVIQVGSGCSVGTAFCGFVARNGSCGNGWCMALQRMTGPYKE